MTAGAVTINGDTRRSIRGIRIITGSVILAGSNPTPVDLSGHGSTCLGGVVSLRDTGSAPGDDPIAVTCSPSGATLNIYAWQDTSGTDPTLVASSNNSVSVDFVATMRAS